MTELITPPGAAVTAGPYSPGLLTGGWIFLSGQFPGLVKPARTTVGSSLVAGMRVEAKVVARGPGGTPSAGVPAGR
jgi:enamine deaminase RidA (YjgF/YER057c/UK114 family)